MMTNSNYKLVLTTLINPFHKPFVNDFHLETNLVLHKEAFFFTFTRSPHLSSNGPLGMVYELLSNCFVLNNFFNGFDFS